ncbi:hypothetical protein [Marinicella litoralis]|uniref:Lipoprotein n=1 Tax=Marinicella litoralis TaxID=644220 RepID=A0A4R6XTJ8_9GAMM|nr:hypothetical protein [Marinicella litoralis]TDR23282.1 hypothetical protein C8D91_0142 [Marinicella litoralis]
MKKTLLIIALSGIAMSQMASSCTPEPEISKPPRLVNGEWIQEAKPSAKELAQVDFDQLKKMNFTYVFSGIYRKEASFNNKPMTYIQTKKIWQGKVTETVDIDLGKPPTDNKCSPMKLDEEYIFFAKLGGRNNPIHLKSFRKATPTLKALLGKPTKQWLRGRLIHSKK